MEIKTSHIVRFWFGKQSVFPHYGTASEKMDITVVATAKPGQFFVANTMHNLVVEPLVEESEVDIIEERVEE